MWEEIVKRYWQLRFLGKAWLIPLFKIFVDNDFPTWR
jgi:hypothetical protein